MIPLRSNNTATAPQYPGGSDAWSEASAASRRSMMLTESGLARPGLDVTLGRPVPTALYAASILHQ